MASRVPDPVPPRRRKEPEYREVAIGSFIRMEQIGQGSFATVYKARHAKRGGFVAIKSVNLARLSKKLKDNLYIEIQILKDLHHPHIVALLDCREGHSHIHIVMEYCPLGDLSLFIRKREALTRHADFEDIFRRYPNPRAGGIHEVLVRHFLQQIASALEFLRSKSLMHRDVKPQNLLLNPAVQVAPEATSHAHALDSSSEDTTRPLSGLSTLPMLKLADFGFARSLPTTALAETLCGSPLYMAPEILRYEKYDAKADLWSVGTVAYEMATGKPPFRATNHIDLLRKIEQAQDVIRYPEEPRVSRDVKTLTRALLKRNPVERMGFEAFFQDSVINGEIPGVVAEDRSAQLRKPIVSTSTRSTESIKNARPALPERQRSTNRVPRPAGLDEVESGDRFVDAVDYVQPSSSQRERPTPTRPHLPSSVTAPMATISQAQRRASPSPARPPSQGKATTPSAPSQPRRLSSRSSAEAHRPSPSSRPSARATTPESVREAREAREQAEQAAQDVAFERDYIIVEKRAVEVNALADELAASPRVQGNADSPHSALRRRSTIPASPPSATSSSTPQSAAAHAQARALQLLSGRRPDHLRSGSYERRVRSGISTSSAISKAITLASGRLFSFGLSPPLGLGSGGASGGRNGPSPPTYSPFPSYPTAAGASPGPLLLEEASPATHKGTSDEESRIIRAVEESAHRSDVVYGFAEVKFKQLIPLAPSFDAPSPVQPASAFPGAEGEPGADDEDGLTVYAVVALSEEALVLYLKSLSLLAKAMDLAAALWARKNTGGAHQASSGSSRPSSNSADEPYSSSAPPTGMPKRSATNAAVVRLNKVVQWVRDRFNEVLEKAEFVRMKLLAAQKRLPLDHPQHPSNIPATSSLTAAATSGAMSAGTSVDSVRLSPGISAEKLMYARALEMGRGAAVNELVCEDLAGCEIAYITAIRMLEAVLDTPGDHDSHGAPRSARRKDSSAGALSDRDCDQDIGGAGDEGEELVNAEDRASVLKLVQSFRTRLVALQKKLKVLADRQSPTPPTSSAGLRPVSRSPGSPATALDPS